MKMISTRSPNSRSAIRRALAQRSDLHSLSLCSFLLRDDFSCVKFDEHRAVCLYLLDWDGEAKVVEEQELEFEMV